MKEVHDRSAGLMWRLMVCGALLVAAGCATNLEDEALPARTVRLRGGVRYSTDERQHWTMVKVGQLLPPGCFVQTAAESRIDIALGDPPSSDQIDQPSVGWSLRSPVVRSSSPADAQRHLNQAPGQTVCSYLASGNIIRAWENSLIRLERLKRSLTKFGTHISEEVQLELRSGHITLNVSGMPAGFEYEVKWPKGVINVRTGTYDLTAEGVVKVQAGRASVTVLGSTETHAVIGGEMFDARTGARTRLPTY